MTDAAATVQLRAKGERAVLVGADPASDTGAVREVDPSQLPLPGDLTVALHEWARVAAAVGRTRPAAADLVVSRRGRQLAGRVAAALGVPIGYLDPITDEAEVFIPPTRPAPIGSARPTADEPAEPTPWLPGLAISLVSAVIVAVAVLTLATTLTATSKLLAVGATLVVGGGLLPSVWLARRTPVWRWVAYGVAAGIGVSLLFLPVAVL